jgi:hypothetical protein
VESQVNTDELRIFIKHWMRIHRCSGSDLSKRLNCSKSHINDFLLANHRCKNPPQALLRFFNLKERRSWEVIK